MEPGTTSKEYSKQTKDIKIDDNTITLELDYNMIIFKLMIGISYVQYIKEYHYDEIKKELNIPECNNLEEVYDYLTKAEYEINEEEHIILVNKKEIKLRGKTLYDREVITMLIDVINDMRVKHKKEKEEKDKIKREIEEYEDSDEEYDDSEIPKHFKFTSNLLGLKIGLFGHKIKIVDIVIVFIGLFLIFCGGIAALGVAEKVIDNVVFGEKSTISFLLVIVGILFISSVLGPALIKRSSLKGFYEQLQNVDAEPKKDTSSEESDSKDGNKKEENEEESSEEESSKKESKEE